MEFYDLIAKRQSIRAYSVKPVEEEKLQRVLGAANCAPSAGNLQAYEIHVVRDASRREALARAALWQEFIARAPVVLVFSTNPSRAARRYGERGVRLYSLQDATIACTFAMLAAVAEGLSTVWVGAFDVEKVHREIGSPAGIHPVAILPIGYPAEAPGQSPRRRLSDLVHEV